MREAALGFFTALSAVSLTIWTLFATLLTRFPNRSARLAVLLTVPVTSRASTFFSALALGIAFLRLSPRGIFTPSTLRRLDRALSAAAPARPAIAAPPAIRGVFAFLTAPAML
jgi:hypothetical protein